jgi:hypothetical protein
LFENSADKFLLGLESFAAATATAIGLSPAAG